MRPCSDALFDYEDGIAPVSSDKGPEEDPFGLDDSTKDLPRAGAKGYGSVSGIKGAGSPFKAREHYPRVRKHLAKRFGGVFWACDRKIYNAYTGAITDQDLLGFMDIQGVSGGRFISCNVTTKASIGAHLRDYTNPDNTYGQAQAKVETLLREFLRNGGTFVIVGMYQPDGKGARWEFEEVDVDEALLDEYVARKKKR